MIVSTTLAGPGCEAIIGAALKSVAPLVDYCIVIDTCNNAAAVDAAEQAIGPDKLLYYSFVWDGSFAAARNYALQCAKEARAEFALTIDADERLAQASPDAFVPFDQGDVWLCFDEHRTYAKDRLIRLPLKPGSKWTGRVHEAFIPGEGAVRKIYDGWRFNELPKTKGQLRAKFERDLDQLYFEIYDNPKDARWWFYLGETYKNLDDLERARESFLSCIKRSHWDEERAWCCYRIAEIDSLAGQYDKAVAGCTWALEHHAGFAEAAWLAGWCRYQQGQYRDSIFWSRMAEATAATERKELPRIGFRHLPAYLDGPADVARHAWAQLKGKS